MNKFYTQTGDDGYTGLLSEGRVPKYDLRIETIGCIDEATAALGLARSLCENERNRRLLIQVQRDLYHLMAEIAALPENAAHFRVIDAGRVAWIEAQTDEISEEVGKLRDFIIPGDSPGSAALSLARNIVRRAERRAAQLYHNQEIENEELLRYLNRLSSLCFVLEVAEARSAGNASPTLAKES